jgi:fructose-1,6-bisphosphatase I
MADAPMTLSEHLASLHAALPPGLAPGVAAIVGRIGRVAAVIAQELAHAALRDRLGYVGGVNVSGDEVKKLDVWGHEAMLAGLRQSGACAAFVSEESKEPIEIPKPAAPGSRVL